MKKDIKWLAIKVGKKEHLESLKAGRVFFAANKVFIEDKTDFRGDPNEGSRFVDPTKIEIYIDGKNIFHELNVPYPYEVKESFEGIEEIHIFCCSVLRDDVWKGNERKKLTNAFISEMSQFGDHFLIFDLNELVENVKIAATESGIGMISSLVKYKDIFSDFSPVEFPDDSFYNRFFIKDREKYEVQSEYRIIVDGATETLKNNCERGYILNIKPLESANVFNIDLLNSVELITKEI